MGVTNGFLRLSQEEFQQLKTDQGAFAQRARARDESNGYLDMDKAGYELLFILDSPLAEDDVSPPYPNIVKVLSGGQPIFPNLDLGYGPARIVDENALEQSLSEFDRLDYDTVLSLAMDEIVSEMLMADVSEDDFRDYYWDYLQSLGDFLKQAVENNMVVLRY